MGTSSTNLRPRTLLSRLRKVSIESGFRVPEFRAVGLRHPLRPSRKKIISGIVVDGSKSTRLKRQTQVPSSELFILPGCFLSDVDQHNSSLTLTRHRVECRTHEVSDSSGAHSTRAFRNGLIRSFKQECYHYVGETCKGVGSSKRRTLDRKTWGSNGFARTSGTSPTIFVSEMADR
jgi:hypothetical protein